MPHIDMTGQRFGRWTAIRVLPSINRRGLRWECVCECGTVRAVLGVRLRNGTSRSCGCLIVDTTRRMRTTHGMSKKLTHRIWCGMITRCTNPNHKSYKRYGGCGITVCRRWRDSFELFLEDMGECQPGLSLDRIDNSRGYEPGNCRWATDIEQVRNSRRAKLNVDIVRQVHASLIGGEQQAAIARRLNVSKSTIHSIAKGETWADIFSEFRGHK